jgi:hypothetical protein
MSRLLNYRDLIYILVILVVGWLWPTQTLILKMNLNSEPRNSDYSLLEAAHIRNNAPFTFSACLLIVDENKVSEACFFNASV